MQTAPALVVTALTLPARISAGQTFTASMTVTNTGQAAASGVLPSPNPPTVTATGGASASTGTTLTPATIAGGASATFTWTFTENGTGPGTLRLGAGAGGTDANSGAAVTAASINSSAAPVEAPAQLSVTSFTAPATISRGQTFTVIMVVSNGGQATANGVLPVPNPPTRAISGGANVATATALTAANIAGGASATFTWTFTENGTGPGTIQFQAGAGGTDANSGAAVNAALSFSNTVMVQTPPQLQVTAFTLPATLSRGQAFQAQMTVTNTGQATANGVLPSPNPPTRSTTGGANASTGTGLTPATIAGGASATFTWNYTENGTGTGTIALSGGASGTDANSGAAVSAAVTSSNTAAVQTPASLTVTSLTLPPRLSRGQTFTVTMVVSNGGQAAATNVVPSPDPLTPVVTGGAAASTSTPHTGVTIAGGGTATITWTYTENGAGTGTLALRGGASGTDGNSGAALTAAAITSAAAAVEQPAALQVSSFTIPAGLSRGQTFTATMVVTNTGQATANGVLPVPNPPSRVTSGGAAASTATVLTAANIAGGASATFTWTFTENGTGPGTLQLQSGAGGTDANSGAAVTAALTSTGTANVVAPAALTSSITSPPGAVAANQFAVKMLVTNTGGATANAVTPSALAPTVAGVVVSLLTSPSPAPIAGGASVTFVWTYSTSAASNGTVRFAGNAAGTDANSGAAVASTSSNSNTTTIVTATAAGLTAAIVTKPRIVAVGDVVTVEMLVTNRSTAARNGIAPSDFTLGGPGQVTLVSGPTPATLNLLAMQSGTFFWTYRATAPGWVTFTGNATSTTPVGRGRARHLALARHPLAELRGEHAGGERRPGPHAHRVQPERRPGRGAHGHRRQPQLRLRVDAGHQRLQPHLRQPHRQPEGVARHVHGDGDGRRRVPGLGRHGGDRHQLPLGDRDLGRDAGGPPLQRRRVQLHPHRELPQRRLRQPRLGVRRRDDVHPGHPGRQDVRGARDVLRHVLDHERQRLPRQPDAPGVRGPDRRLPGGAHPAHADAGHRGCGRRQHGDLQLPAAHRLRGDSRRAGEQHAVPGGRRPRDHHQPGHRWRHPGNPDRAVRPDADRLRGELHPPLGPGGRRGAGAGRRACSRPTARRAAGAPPRSPAPPRCPRWPRSRRRAAPPSTRRGWARRSPRR